MMIRFGHVSLLSSALAFCFAAMNSALAQRDAATTNSGIELKLDGSVERAFTSDDRFDNTKVVQVLLRSVALNDARTSVQHVRIPAPGEVLFIVVDDASSTRQSQRAEAGEFPRAGDTIRATVREAGRGVWSASGADWFERIGSGSRQPERDIARDGDSASPPSQLIDLRGMRCEAKVVRGQLGLEVSQVQSQGPAHDAGFQAGDVIVAVGGGPIASTANIRQLALEAKPLELSVIDVNNGRLANVTLAPTPAGRTGPPLRADDTSREASSDAATRIATSLGVSVESTRVGSRGAVKVSAVDRAKPGAQAGLEPGDVIVAIDQNRISSVEEFAQALPVQGGKLTLVVRDVRSGNEVPIEVPAASARPVVRDLDRADESQSAEGAATDRAGLATELAFYNEEAAVKIIAVKPDSPASRAGMRRGWMILKANDTPVLHPDDLAKAEGDATGRLTLRVVDPSNDRQFTISIDL